MSSVLAKYTVIIRKLGYNLIFSKPKMLFDRLAVGLLGIILPVIVSLWADIPLLGSISAYYHALTGNLFALILVIIGLVLISYQGYHPRYEHSGKKDPEPGKDRLLSSIAGIGAIGIVIFPTKNYKDSLTYHEILRDWYQMLIDSSSADLIRYIHLGFTLLFTGMMIWITLKEFTKTSKVRWIILYQICSGIMAIGVVILILGFFEIELINKPIFWGETFAIYGVGLAWLFKFATSVDRSRPFGLFFVILALVGMTLLIIASI